MTGCVECFRSDNDALLSLFNPGIGQRWAGDDTLALQENRTMIIIVTEASNENGYN
jgi:hypothetical protein